MNVYIDLYEILSQACNIQRAPRAKNGMFLKSYIKSKEKSENKKIQRNRHITPREVITNVFLNNYRFGLNIKSKILTEKLE